MPRTSSSFSRHALLLSVLTLACKTAEPDAGRLSAEEPAATAGAGQTFRWAVSSNDNKHTLHDGALTFVEGAPPDTISLIDMKASPPKVAFELAVPGSVIGPPGNVAITPDEKLALVASAMRADPSDPKKATADNRLSVVDLSGKRPRVVQTLEVGTQPSGLSITPDGKLALVANRGEGSVSVLAIRGKKVSVVGKVVLSEPGNAAHKPQTAHVAISRDGKTALATNDGDHRISLLAIDGQKVTVTDTFYAGLKPYSVDIAPSGTFAIVGNVGLAQGDMDTVSLVDLELKPPRVVDTLSVGRTPEGVVISPDSKAVMVVLQNGTNKPKKFPFYASSGKLSAIGVEGKKLKPLSEVAIGGWGQSAVFSPDGKHLLVGTMLGKSVEWIAWDGSTLRHTGTKLPVKGGVAALRTAAR